MKKSSFETGAIARTTRKEGFIYEVEYCQNPTHINIKTRERFPGIIVKHFSAFSKKSLEAGIHSEKVHQFYKDLVKVQGLRTVYASRDGTTFGCELDTDHKWEKVLLEIVSVFQEHLAGKQKMIRVGRKSQPTSREYAAVHREQAKEGSW